MCQHPKDSALSFVFSLFPFLSLVRVLSGDLTLWMHCHICCLFGVEFLFLVFIFLVRVLQFFGIFGVEFLFFVFPSVLPFLFFTFPSICLFFSFSSETLKWFSMILDHFFDCLGTQYAMDFSILQNSIKKIMLCGHELVMVSNWML